MNGNIVKSTVKDDNRRIWYISVDSNLSQEELHKRLEYIKHEIRTKPIIESEK